MGPARARIGCGKLGSHNQGTGAEHTAPCRWLSLTTTSCRAISDVLAIPSRTIPLSRARALPSTVARSASSPRYDKSVFAGESWEAPPSCRTAHSHAGLILLARATRIWSPSARYPAAYENWEACGGDGPTDRGEFQVRWASSHSCNTSIPRTHPPSRLSVPVRPHHATEAALSQSPPGLVRGGVPPPKAAIDERMGLDCGYRGARGSGTRFPADDHSPSRRGVVMRHSCLLLKGAPVRMGK